MCESQQPFSIEVSLPSRIISKVNGDVEQEWQKRLLDANVDEIFYDWKYCKDHAVILAKLDEHSCILYEERFEDKIEYFVFLVEQMKNLVAEIKNLNKLNRRLDAVIENSYDGIYITDIEGTTLLTNSAIERITGIPKEYYMGKKVDALMKRGILESSLTQRVIEQKTSVSHVQYNRAGNESLLLTGSPIFSEDGEVESVVTNIRDLSQLIELQTELQKANKLNQTYRKEIARLKKDDETADSHVIIRSEKMKQLYETANQIVNVDATILILGQTGVGKDVLAQYIYNKSERRLNGRYIKLNCGAIPVELLESELFGYEHGAFTGAKTKGKAGMFELADGGILFLDEVGELPLNAQVKLLRVIQNQEVQRIGAVQSRKIDVRLIAATNKDLKKMVEEGTFREDLYYRLNVIPITIPPLEERREDILPLADHFVRVINTKYKMNKTLSEEVKFFMYHYNWPGNIRELSNFIERLLLIVRDSVITINHLPQEYKPTIQKLCKPVSSRTTLKEAVEEAEKNLLLKSIEKCSSTYELAEMLDTSQPTIFRKLKKYNIELR